MGCAAKKPSKDVQRTEKIIVDNYNNQEIGSTIEFFNIEKKTSIHILINFFDSICLFLISSGIFVVQGTSNWERDFR